MFKAIVSKFWYLFTWFFLNLRASRWFFPWSCPAPLESSLRGNCLLYHRVCLPSALWAVTSCQDWMDDRGLQSALHLLAVLWIPIHKKFLAYVIYIYTHTSHSRSCPWTGILSTASNLVMLLTSSQFYKFLCKYFITKPCKIYFSSLWKNWILIFLFCNEEEILT